MFESFLDPLRAPLLPENGDCPQSPPGDDMTDLGQSEVFDDSISEARKIGQENSPREKKTSFEDKSTPIARHRSKELDNKRNKKRTEDNGGRLDKKPTSKEKVETQDSLPKTPKYNAKAKHFNFPEQQHIEMKDEPQLVHKDSRKIKSSRALAEVAPPQAANNEFIYKDYSKKEPVKPSTPLMKPKHKRLKDRRGSNDSRKIQYPAKQNFEPLTGKESFPILPDKVKARPRTGSEKASKYVDSPSRKKRPSKDRRDTPPSVVIDMHGPDKDPLVKKETLPLQNVEEIDDEMQTIPIIKVIAIFFRCK